MAGEKDDPRTAPDETPEDERDEPAVTTRPADDDPRDEELAGKRKIKKACRKIHDDVARGFEDQIDRTNEQLDYWDLYHAKLTGKQFYAGNSRIFVPIIPNAVNARKTRFVNQVFPQSGRYVEVLASEAAHPNALASLLEHYIRRGRLRSRIMPALMKNGDIEGQYNIYVSWRENKRDVAWRQNKPPSLPAQDGQPAIELEDVEGDEEEVYETTITQGFPHAELISDADVLVLPQTADSVEDAIECGGSVTILRRYTKSQIEQMIEDEEIDKDAGEKLLEAFGAKQKDGSKPDVAKAAVDNAGIKSGSTGMFALVYETWTRLAWKGQRYRFKILMGGEDLLLSCKRNPYWSDRIPLLSAAVEKEANAFKGVSKLRQCADMQYAANDAVNEGMDSAAYALMPIIMTDPAKNPRVGSMILNVAAIWETSPTDTQFAKFPELWRSAFEIVTAAKAEVFQTLSVTPSQIPQQASTGKRRMNQAEIANEQQVDILTTADVVTNVADEILTPLLHRFLELDHQFRREDMTIRQFGELGVAANMEKIPPIQMHKRYEFRWYGVEAARTAQQMQQQIGAINVLTKIPPTAYPGYKLNLQPAIALIIENTWGPRVGSQIFTDLRKELGMEAKLENEYLAQGIDLPVHMVDNDAEHMKEHQQAMQNDASGAVRMHVLRHVQQIAQKQQQAMMQQQQQALPPPEGGGPPRGGPRAGAQPGQVRGGQNPPGAIHQDRMIDASAAPRR